MQQQTKTVAKPTKGFEAGYSLAKAIILPWFKVSFRINVEGAEHVPRSGPALIAVNHISLFDPLVVAWAIDRRAGRRPRFLAKSSLFKAPVVGWILRTARQIRVERGTRAAVNSLADAERGIRDGEVLVIFPEGTTSLAPDLAPLKPKTGVARISLETGVPVIPCATWGGQWVWGYHVGFKPGIGKELWVRFGEPMDFSEYASRKNEPQALHEVSERVMEQIGVLAAGLKTIKPWTPRPPKKNKKSKNRP